MARLAVRLFGYPHFLLDNVPVKVERRKTIALAAYLAVEAAPNRGIPSRAYAQISRPPLSTGCGRETLASLLWPDCPQDQAGAYLRQALWDFSKAAGDEWIIKSSPFVSFNPEADYWVDVTAFEDLLGEWNSNQNDEPEAISLLTRLSELYSGDFLAGFSLRDSPPFDDWQALQTETHRLHLSRALEALARLQSAAGDLEHAALHARRWLSLDPLNEAAHRTLMALYEETGQHSAALRQFEACEKALDEELGLRPDAETLSLFERIKSGSFIHRKPPARARPGKTLTGRKRVGTAKPSGTVTFLFSDIEGSTQLWERYPEAMKAAFVRQEAIIREAMAAQGGYVYKMIGDSFQVAFASAPAALSAAVAAQRSLLVEPWGEIGSLKVRMALHSGVTEEREDDYVGPTLNRVARLMSAAYGGQVLLNQSTLDLLGDCLPQGISLRHLGAWWLKDLVNAEKIYQVVSTGLPEHFPKLKALEVHPANFPPENTPFVGREAELARLETLLNDPACRLISLVGIGGAGKTRLGVQAAQETRSFPDGVYFAGLASVSTLDDLYPAIARALNLVFETARGVNLSLSAAQQQLFDYLAAKRALIVLDNFEQLTDCAAFLDALLQAAPDVKLIVTTRERLNLPGEWVVEVTGLAYPGRVEEDLVPQFAAVQLFTKSAERTGSFQPSAADWPAIARICQLLEGMPLGIEMAAAWVKMLSCQEISAEIEKDLDFLSATWRGMPERHRTLRAIFEHSWKLLPEAERAVFVRLSIFDAGFSRDAALEIAAAPIHTLSSLSDKSFLRRIGSGRFEIHPLLRQYAAEMLAGDPSAMAEVQFRHAAFFSDWLSRMHEKLKGSEQLTALVSLRAESQNLLKMWRYHLEQRDMRQLRRLLIPLIHFFTLNDQRIEIPELTRLLLEMLQIIRSQQASSGQIQPGPAPAAPDNTLLALTLAAIRFITIDFRHMEQSNLYQEECLKYVDGLPDSLEKAMILLLNATGPVLLQPQQALELCIQSTQLFNQVGDTWGTALAQLVLGDIASFAKKDSRWGYMSYQASLETFTRLGNTWGRALSLNGLLFLEYWAGNLKEACRLGRECLEIYDRIGNYERMLMVRHLLGEISERLGALDDARHYFEGNVAHYTHSGNQQQREYYQTRLEAMAKG